jgi:signal transduction histidine kinase
MLITTNCNKYFFKLIIPVGVLCLLFTIFSCNNPRDDGPGTVNFDTVLDTASQTYDFGNPQKAIYYLDSAIKNYHHLNPAQRFRYFTYHFNYYYFVLANTDTSMLYADSMLALFVKPEDKLKYAPQYGLANFYKGDVLFDENKYEDAYQYYYQGKLVASNQIDDCILSDYDYRLGMIMYKQEHFKAGAAYFKTGTQQVNKCDLTFRSFLRRQELYNNTGLCYGKINEDDSALLYFNLGLKFIDSAGARFNGHKEDLEVDRGVIYGNEANIYIKRNNYLVAEALLNKSIVINLKKNNDNRDAQLSELKLAHLFLLQNKNDSLINLLQVIKFQFDTIKNQVAESDWNELMSTYYIRQKQPQMAFGYLLRHNKLKDTLTEISRQLKEADVNGQMDRLKKDYEFAQLKKHHQQQHYYLIAIIILSLMLVVIISLIFINWQKSKRNIKILGGLNQQINEQNYNLEHALSELNLSSREKDRILRTVAHDLRNPIGGIASLAALMAEESSYTDEQKEMINLIRETSNNSMELINEILEITDNLGDKLQKEKELSEINSLAGKSVELLRFKAAEKNQQIVLKLLDAPVELFISREKIWRVISNLISNAIKFSHENTIVHVTLSKQDNHIQIAVADNGIGIPDNLKGQIFNTFTDAKRPGTAGEKSFGLGLSICQQIIENHNGKIWFDSSPNGTTFFISLPLP